MSRATLLTFIVTVCVLQPIVESQEHRPVIISGALVDAVTGLAVGNGSIELVVISRPETTGPRSITGQADNAGSFTLRVAAGLYRIAARAPGYQTSLFGQRSPKGSAETLDVKTGGKPLSVVVRMWPESSIEGAVTNSLSARLRGLTISLFQWTAVSGRRCARLVATQATGSAGEYRFSGLSAGDYVVAHLPFYLTRSQSESMSRGFPASLRPPSATGASGTGRLTVELGNDVVQAVNVPAIDRETGRLQVIQPVFYPHAKRPSHGVSLATSLGQHHKAIDLKLQAVPGSTVAGSIQASPGSSLQQVPIVLVPEAGNDLCAEAAQYLAATLSAGDGTFRISGVAPGDYIVRAATPRTPATTRDVQEVRTEVVEGIARTTYIGADGVSRPASLSTAPVWSGSELVRVGTADSLGLVVRMAEGHRITGRVVYQGQLAVAPGQVLQNTLVALEPAFGDGTSQARGALDSSGTLTTEYVAVGDYFVRLAGIPTGWALDGVMSGGVDISDTATRLDQDLDGVRVVLTDRPTVLMGLVRSKTGEQWSGEIDVHVFPEDRRLWTGFGVNPRRLKRISIRSGQTYRFVGLPAGRYFVAAAVRTTDSEWKTDENLTRMTRDAGVVLVSQGQTTVQNLTIMVPVVSGRGGTAREAAVACCRWPR